MRVAEARKTAMVEDVVFSGDIQPQAQVNVSFRTNGKVAKRLVEVGIMSRRIRSSPNSNR